VILGRTNMDEFAMGSSTEQSVYGPTKNPHDPTRVAGGSSGGSAVAVAANMAWGALGSETGGSIRQPAGFCGVVGLKPTYGAVSRNGLMAMASSLDQIGPFAETVSDTETIFDVIKGKDPMDSTSADHAAGSPKHGKPVVGIPKKWMEGDGMDADVREVVERAIETLRGAGFDVRDVSLPHTRFALSVYYIIVPAEVSANLARYDGVRFGLSKEGADVIDGYFKTRGAGFGPEVRRRVILGTYVLSHGYYDAYYRRASRVRRLIGQDFENAFLDVDCIVAPVSPKPAFKLGEKVKDPLSMYLEDIFLVPANLAGIPALSLPYGAVERDGKKLPVGVQLIGPRFGEGILFDIGKFLEAHR
ncbi:MAG: Asp-tRNA(Asn)/Glu-tRNA(Gln) amidotransferase subunit GatA, partial [Candidatus Niyogibacteria bacterium]|nr:Asp-tRNA(Asn)/Glu-tRNA(Gln) amidotransferase subunit GatA [Candidatus Niyogibacteria bacterium]